MATPCSGCTRSTPPASRPSASRSWSSSSRTSRPCPSRWPWPWCRRTRSARGRVESVRLDGSTLAGRRSPRCCCRVPRPGRPRRPATSPDRCLGGQSVGSFDELSAPDGDASAALIFPLPHTAVLRVALPIDLPPKGRGLLPDGRPRGRAGGQGLGGADPAGGAPRPFPIPRSRAWSRPAVGTWCWPTVATDLAAWPGGPARWTDAGAGARRPRGLRVRRGGRAGAGHHPRAPGASTDR